jgi:protein-tyrosine phosphatase
VSTGYVARVPEPQTPNLPPDRVIVPAANLRDIGGLPTEDGRIVRRGRLFRSGYLSELAEEDLERVRSLALRTVVDLRRPSEVDLRPSPPLPGVTRIEVSVSTDDNEFAVLSANLTDPAVTARAPEFAREYNRNLVVRSIAPYRPVFAAAFAAERQPLLFHCTAGKDRTGFVAAILLRLLGVDEDLVRADYVLTNEIRKDWVAQRIEMFRDRIAAQRGVPREEVTDEDLVASRVVLEASADYIQAALDAVPEVHGSWDAFRRDGLGIGDDAFADFAAAMLE